MGVNLTDVEVVAASELASWGRRLVALMIDSVVLATIITVTVLAAGMPPDELSDRIHRSAVENQRVNARLYPIGERFSASTTLIPTAIFPNV